MKPHIGSYLFNTKSKLTVFYLWSKMCHKGEAVEHGASKSTKAYSVTLDFKGYIYISERNGKNK